MIMEISAVLAVVIVFLVIVFTFASAWSLDVSVVIAVIVSVVSAVAAALSAIFAWRSIGFARRQNTIAAQTALLESLLHKSATLEDIRKELLIMKGMEAEQFLKIQERSRQGESLSDMEMNRIMREAEFSQQRIANIIVCYHHYFSENNMNRLKEWIRQVKKSNTWKDFYELLYPDKNELLKFNIDVLPTMLDEMEQKIKHLEAKLEEVSK